MVAASSVTSEFGTELGSQSHVVVQKAAVLAANTSKNANVTLICFIGSPLRKMHNDESDLIIDHFLFSLH